METRFSIRHVRTCPDCRRVFIARFVVLVASVGALALLLLLVSSLGGSPERAEAHRLRPGYCMRYVAAHPDRPARAAMRECRAIVRDHARLHASRPMLSSCYADPTDGFLGRPTASGRPVTSRSRFVAHRTLPLGTRVRIFYRGRATTAIVADRGPYSGRRELDLSWATARAIGFPTCKAFGERTVRVFVFRSRR